jgi:hypothetical protein
VEDGTHRRELPINDQGYAYITTGIDYDSDISVSNDYPSTTLPAGEYIVLITNDIRYLETTYSISIGAFVVDWRYVAEEVDEALDFGLDLEGASSVIDFGSVAG